MPDLNTLPDPRESMDSPSGLRTPPTETNQHPDLSDEVAALSTKLINAINHQTKLDDTLQSTRHELETARERIKHLEQATRHHEVLVSRGMLIKRVDAEEEQDKLSRELVEERNQRKTAEKERKSMEMELENLTSALFEEANQMVAEARRGNDQAERKSDQLRSQLRDSEILLQSHQQQLRELKIVLEEVQTERELELSSRPQTSSTSQTPYNASEENVSRSLELQKEATGSTVLKPIPADQPLRFSNLVRPVLRMDLAASEEFNVIFKPAARTSPASRVNSGNFSGLNLMGVNTGSNFSQPNFTPSAQTQSGSTTSLATAPPVSPSLPGSFNPSSPSEASSITLEKSKFYKRVLTEDIEPTLRLDNAPGLSWLARRSVISSMLSGALAIEPWPPGSRFYSPAYACALCGEQRKAELYVRRHRFRTSDSDDAQRYPLCEYCLERVRATCELVGFLKMIRTGHWHADVVDEVRAAWEDCVKLRERMFWARMGGGVVPVRQAEDAGGIAKLREVTGRSSTGDDEGEDLPLQQTDLNKPRPESIEALRTPSPKRDVEELGKVSPGTDIADKLLTPIEASSADADVIPDELLESSTFLERQMPEEEHGVSIPGSFN